MLFSFERARVCFPRPDLAVLSHLEKLQEGQAVSAGLKQAQEGKNKYQCLPSEVV